MDDPALTGEWAAAFNDYQPRPAPWCDYLALENGRPVGSGGFKTPPDDEGVAEIGYLTFVAERGRGVAKGITEALIELGCREGLAMISAHTLPEENASTAVLRAHGFMHVGDVEDPEDGTVWRWEKGLR